MWLSEHLRAAQTTNETEADLGVITIGSGEVGVHARGEVRGLSICTPAGIAWRPASGDRVVVLQGGPGGEETFVLGVQQEETGLREGELCLHTGGASIRLNRDGSIDIDGKLRINGKAYAPPLPLKGEAQ